MHVVRNWNDRGTDRTDRIAAGHLALRASDDRSRFVQFLTKMRTRCQRYGKNIVFIGRRRRSITSYPAIAIVRAVFAGLPPFLRERRDLYLQRNILMEYGNRLGGKSPCSACRRNGDELDTPATGCGCSSAMAGSENAPRSTTRTLSLRDGCNHQGDVDIARMIEVANIVRSMRQAAKTRHRALSDREQYQKPYEISFFGKTMARSRIPGTDRGRAYRAQRNAKVGVDLFVSAWDAHSAQEMIDIGCDIIKLRRPAYGCRMLPWSISPTWRCQRGHVTGEITHGPIRCDRQAIILLAMHLTYPAISRISFAVFRAARRYTGRNLRGVQRHHLGIASGCGPRPGARITAHFT